MSDTKGLYDDPAFLRIVKAEFKGKYPTAALRLTQPQHRDYINAACMWECFKAGVKFAVTEGLKEEVNDGG